MQGNAFKPWFVTIYMQEIRVVGRILDVVIEENHDSVANWLNNKSGSWGALAGKGIVAVTRAEGRSLTQEEKRVVWHLMWKKLESIKNSSVSSA